MRYIHIHAWGEHQNFQSKLAKKLNIAMWAIQLPNWHVYILSLIDSTCEYEHMCFSHIRRQRMLGQAYNGARKNRTKDIFIYTCIPIYIALDNIRRVRFGNSFHEYMIEIDVHMNCCFFQYRKHIFYPCSTFFFRFSPFVIIIIHVDG